MWITPQTWQETLRSNPSFPDLKSPHCMSRNTQNCLSMYQHYFSYLTKFDEIWHIHAHIYAYIRVVDAHIYAYIRVLYKKYLVYYVQGVFSVYVSERSFHSTCTKELSLLAGVRFPRDPLDLAIKNIDLYCQVQRS